MKMEHFAIIVENTKDTCKWYAENLGFSIKKEIQKPDFFVAFISDSAGMMIEVYDNPAVELPNYREMDPLTFHIAFVSNNVDDDVKRLQSAGATLLSGPEVVNGDKLAMLRDPWGVPIQLCNRENPF